MKILVTGGAGFIGANFVHFMLRRHPRDQIVVLDKLTYAGNLANLKAVMKKIKFIKGDICDRKLVEKVAKGIDVFVNFAAESHVDRSIAEPEPFLTTNILGTQVLLEAARRFDHEKFVQISCYDEDTRALTMDGFKRYDQIKEGDLVLSLNPKTNKIEIKPVEKVIIQHYRGKMRHFKNKRIDLLVTPNHNMFILNTTKKLIVEPAEKVSKRSLFYMPKGYWEGENDDSANIDGHGSVKTEDLMYILGIYIGDGFTAYQEEEIETKSGLIRPEFLKEAREKTTGKFKKIEKRSDYKSKSHSYRIFLDIPKNDKARKKVEKALSNLNVNFHPQKGKAGEHIYFTSKPFFELFNKCGQGAKTKHIPNWILEYSPKYLQYLFQGLVDSNGYFNGKNCVFYTSSEKLVANFCELCFKLGLKPRVGKRYSVSSIKNREIRGSAYYVLVSKTDKSINKNKVNTINYDGTVWCLKVKDNKNFIVERNGRLDFCGNTDEVYGSILKGSFKESDPINPSSPYSATKSAADILVSSYCRTYGLDALVTRCTNNFGPYQHPEKFMPKTIVRALSNLPIPIYGTGKNIRDWIYVLDHCEAIDLLLRKGRRGEVYNVSTGNELENLEVVKLVLEAMGKSEDLITFVKDRPGHDFRYSLDSSKLKKLGWKPRYSFQAALKQTVEWYTQNKWWWKPIATKKVLSPTPWELRW